MFFYEYIASDLELFLYYWRAIEYCSRTWIDEVNIKKGSFLIKWLHSESSFIQVLCVVKFI